MMQCSAKKQKSKLGLYIFVMISLPLYGMFLDMLKNYITLTSVFTKNHCQALEIYRCIEPLQDSTGYNWTETFSESSISS